MTRSTLAGLVLAAVGSAAPAQVLHESDLVIRLGGDGHIETGLLGAGGGIVWGERIVAGRLDLGQFANLADDPGFDSFTGAFPPGAAIGFDLLAALSRWEDDEFEADKDYAMSVTKGVNIVTTPPTDTRVEGFTFGSADVNGRFHHHVRYFLDPFDPVTDVPGLWLLQLELWSTSPVVLPSEPVFIVFASGPDAAALQDDAIAWIEANLIGGACSPADLAEPLGVLDLADISAFVAGFVAQDVPADLAEPFGVFDLNDITAFVGAFAVGCP